jgi:hypothetical protein
MKLGIFIRYLIVALATYFASCYFVGCNSTNHSHSSVNIKDDSTKVKAKDSTHLSTFDSGSTKKRDSSSVNKQKEENSKVAKHIDDKKIVVNFDTGAKNFNNVNPYKYNVGGSLIISPQPITSTIIDDNNEDDSSSNIVNTKSDSTKVNTLDSTHKQTSDSTHNKGSDSTHLNKQINKDDNNKQTSRFSFVAIIAIVASVAIVVGGILLYLKYK